MSKQVRITIKTDNDAFVESPTGEIARILRKLAQDIETDGGFGPVMDINGNKVGTASS